MSDGGKRKLQDPPFKYKFYLWRKTMHIPLQEALETPIDQIVSDLYFISAENTYLKDSR